MPYTQPTPTDFKNRFSEFATVPDAAIENVIVLANRFVDNTWLEGDYQLAILYLAAHFLYLARSSGGGGLGVTGTSGVRTYLRSAAFGDRRLVYAAVASSEAKTAAQSTEVLGETPYGQLYLLLLRRNAPIVLIV